ncbi:unnamed protein product [Periconia digitata]|uniref:Zn(2)-C6 fungal-type domain-containing protein n=1 Tax=Periconia digitata TaxID=1303443 RepID=A0A9W4ULA1_9PLEO|nr:unnamed protein product [Periconia digitata]
MPNIHRPTQRAPLSCTSCASRKVKCSKTIPCRACISRGTAATCKREVVVVRGRVRTADASGSSPSVAELLLENARLAEIVSRSHGTDVSNAPAVDLTEFYERRLYEELGRVREPRTVASLADVALPTEQCSNFFVEFADKWTSWVHFAFFFPDFRDEHDRFWKQGASFYTYDPLWLSIYFGALASALGFMSDEDFVQSGAPLDSRTDLARNWFHAALFYLDRGDFLQVSHVNIVRSIVVMGNVASTIGETHRHANLWALAVRIAQQLNLGSDKMNPEESVVQRESRRRLWWTLVICEWLMIPLRTPCITNVDFTCELPAELNDTELIDHNYVSQSTPRPVQYHIFMARIAAIYHQFHAKIRLRRWSPSGVADFVIQADDELAAIIEQLPRHLRHDEVVPNEEQITLESQFPWIATQRTSLAMVLLYYRLAINRILQGYWLEGSTNFARARSVCLFSAIHIIRSADSGAETFNRLRSWDFAMFIFSATVTIALEVQRTETPDPQCLEAIAQGKQLLGKVQFQNKLAREALSILQEFNTP